MMNNYTSRNNIYYLYAYNILVYDKFQLISNIGIAKEKKYRNIDGGVIIYDCNVLNSIY